MANPEDKQMKMQWITVDGRTVPLVLPQIWDPDKEDWAVTSTENPLQVDAQLTGSNIVLDVNVLNQPEPYNPRLQEQLSETDAVNGELTFSENLSKIEIYNRDVNEGVFTVNNLEITVPAETSFDAEVGGTPSNKVNVTGSASYIVGRYA